MFGRKKSFETNKSLNVVFEGRMGWWEVDIWPSLECGENLRRLIKGVTAHEKSLSLQSITRILKDPR